MHSSKDRVVPQAGQESVWDYPRPPRLEAEPQRLVVRFAGETVADTVKAFRVLETSHPPVYYIPRHDIRDEMLVGAPDTSFCEFKGIASYVSLVRNGRRSEKAGWRYLDPTVPFRAITGCVAFYASRVDEAWVGDEQVVAQRGDFYGGWITSKIVGPFKGGAGTIGW